jgi:hypothetical protein
MEDDGLLFFGLRVLGKEVKYGGKEEGSGWKEDKGQWGG